MSNRVMKIILPAIAFLWIAAEAETGAVQVDSSVSFTVSPADIKIGTLYHGANVRISAQIASCDGVVIKIQGRDEEIKLSRKGKIAVIWLNVAHILVKNAPQVYILTASDELEKICSLEERERLGLGLQMLEKKITFESDKQLVGGEFDEFVKLKEHSGVYDVNGRVTLTPNQGGLQHLESILPIPSAMPPGTYTIQLYGFRDGNLVEYGKTELSIEMIGLPRFFTALGFDHGAIYGIVAIAVALMAGSIMAVIFSIRTTGRRQRI